MRLFHIHYKHNGIIEDEFVLDYTSIEAVKTLMKRLKTGKRFEKFELVNIRIAKPIIGSKRAKKGGK